MIKSLQKYKKRIDVPLLSITFFIIFLGMVTLSGSNLDTSSIIGNQVINLSSKIKKPKQFVSVFVIIILYSYKLGIFNS